MADTKISALPAATTPLAGTEVLPIVQGGVTEKVAVDDLTVKNIRSNATNGILQIVGPAAAATRVMTTPDANFTAARTDAAQSFTGDQTLSTGNLIIGTSGKGIDFSATPGTGTSELFDDYEEGAFTPTVIGSVTAGTGTYSANDGFYTKVGDRVTFTILINMSAHTGSGNMRLAGLPFTSSAVTNDISYVVAAASNLTFTGQLTAQVSGNSTEIALLSMVTAMSLAAVVLDTSCDLRLTGVYRSA
jgi:hypothetical protein